MNVEVCYPKTADTPILLFVPSSTYAWKWNKNIDSVSLQAFRPQELDLDVHVPMTSLKRGLERELISSFATRSNFRKHFNMRVTKRM